jgi:hypothetical protein
MFIQNDNDIMEILNDDILFIVILQNDGLSNNGLSNDGLSNNGLSNDGLSNDGLNDLISIYLIKRDGEKIFGKMTRHSLYIYSKFVMDKEKWNLLILNINL